MTLPHFDYNDFPIETDQAQIEVTLPVGRHVLQLVVEDTAGLRSAPSTVVITVEGAPPVINQIQPNSGQQGETVPAEITGENLLGMSQVSFAGSGVSANILQGGTNTSVPIEIAISPQAATGPHNFTVTTPGGTAASPGGVEFTVTPAATSVITVRPASGPVSATVNIEGAGFAPSSQISITFDTVSVSTVTSDNRGAWASLVRVPESTLGERQFTATDANGTSASAPFRVESTAPIITAINPNNGPQGAELLEVTISGQNLARAAVVTFSGAGVIVNRIVSSTGTSISVEITVAPGAAIGPRSFTVATPVGAVSSPVGAAFMVQPRVPVITGINPSNVASSPLGATSFMEVTIYGQNLAQAEAVTFSGGDVAAQIVSSTNTVIRAHLSIFPGASPGSHNITVATPVGRAVSPANVTLTVQALQPGAPIIYGINPNNIRQGTRQPLPVIISGQNFPNPHPPSGPSGLTFSGTGITVHRLTPRGNTSIISAINAMPDAPLGARSFTITHQDGTTTTSPSNAVLMVRDSTLVIAGINPDRGNLGTVVDALITGRNLNIFRLTFDDGGLGTQRITTHFEENQISLQIVIGMDAQTGLHAFTLHTQEGGTFNSATFGVNFIVEPVSQLTITPAIPTFSPTFGPIIPSTIRLTASPAASSAAAIQPVSTLSGIGATLNSRLEGSGIRTVSDLALAQSAQVAQILGVSEVRATSFIDEARRLRGQ